MHILIIDNYDSFTYNIAHTLKTFKVDISVFRNDKIDLREVDKFDQIILSPGPGTPQEAGILTDVVRQYAPTKSILGVCLGQQAIGEVFGGRLENLRQVYHGVESHIEIVKKDPLFEGIDKNFIAGRYHSWVVSKNNFPDSLDILAVDAQEQQIMALRHRRFRVWGVQFHPESILTPQGKIILQNWLAL